MTYQYNCSDGRGMTRDYVDAFIVSLALEFCYREIVILDSLNVLSAVKRRCLEYTRDALVSIRSLLDEVSTISTAYTIPSEGPGRPTLFISQEQLTFLVESNFTVPKIANILGVSI